MQVRVVEEYSVRGRKAEGVFKWGAGERLVLRVVGEERVLRTAAISDASFTDRVAQGALSAVHPVARYAHPAKHRKQGAVWHTLSVCRLRAHLCTVVGHKGAL
jgi:hypothetical protein